MTLYIKKLWSLNPNKYKNIPLHTALDEYYKYCVGFVDYARRNGHTYGDSLLKTFEEWRTTEI